MKGKINSKDESNQKEAFPSAFLLFSMVIFIASFLRWGEVEADYWEEIIYFTGWIGLITIAEFPLPNCLIFISVFTILVLRLLKYFYSFEYSRWIEIGLLSYAFLHMVILLVGFQTKGVIRPGSTITFAALLACLIQIWPHRSLK